MQENKKYKITSLDNQSGFVAREQLKETNGVMLNIARIEKLESINEKGEVKTSMQYIITETEPRIMCLQNGSTEYDYIQPSRLAIFDNKESFTKYKEELNKKSPIIGEERGQTNENQRF